MELPAPRTAVTRVRQDVERNALRARNGIRLAVGSGGPRVGVSPKDTIWRSGRCELWRYRNDNVSLSPPLLIVFSLVSRSYILDLTPGNSFVEHLLDAGFDVFLLDWGVPDERDANNTLEDYVDEYLPAAVAELLRATGNRELNLLGYCVGGVLALLYAAAHPRAPLRSLTALATPVDFDHVGPTVDLFRVGGLAIDDVLDDNGNVPPEVILQGFRTQHPTADLTRYANLWERLWSDEYVAAYQAMTGWSQDHIPFPGTVARQVAALLIADNALLTDRFRLGGRAVHLSDIRWPFLAVLANRDQIVPLPAAAPLIDLVGSAEKHELRLDAGHMGLAVGRTAAKTTIPIIIDFLRRHSEQAQPDMQERRAQ